MSLDDMSHLIDRSQRSSTISKPDLELIRFLPRCLSTFLDCCIFSLLSCPFMLSFGLVCNQLVFHWCCQISTTSHPSTRFSWNWCETSWRAWKRSVHKLLSLRLPWAADWRSSDQGKCYSKGIEEFARVQTGVGDHWRRELAEGAFCMLVRKRENIEWAHLHVP